MGCKTSHRTRPHLACLASLLAITSIPALAIGERESLQCSTDATVPQSLLSYSAIDAVSPLSLTCTGGPASDAGTTNVNLLLDTGVANTSTTGMPLLTITFDQCSHVGDSILCPPGVPAGSNSQFFDGSGNIVFPGPVTVSPGNIFPYTPPASFFGTPSGNGVQWQGVPVDVKAKGRRVMRFTNVRPNVSQLPGASPTSNLPVFGSFTSSSTDLSLVFPTSLAPGSSKFLLGVATPATSSALCDSPLFIGSDFTPFVLNRQVTVGGTPYDAITTLSGLSPGMLTLLDLYAYTPSTPGSCQGTSLFNPVSGALDLQNVSYLGQNYWGQAELSGSSRFINLRYGTGTIPAR